MSKSSAVTSSIMLSSTLSTVPSELELACLGRPPEQSWSSQSSFKSKGKATISSIKSMASSELELSSLMTSSENARIKIYSTNDIGTNRSSSLSLNKFIGSESTKKN